MVGGEQGQGTTDAGDGQAHRMGKLQAWGGWVPCRVVVLVLVGSVGLGPGMWGGLEVKVLGGDSMPEAIDRSGWGFGMRARCASTSSPVASPKSEKGRIG